MTHRPTEIAPEPPPGFLRDVVDFWTRPVRAESLALFRILVASALLVNGLVTFLPNLLRWLAPDGMLPVSLMDGWLKSTDRFCLFRGPVGLPIIQDLVPAEFAAAWAAWGESRSGVATLFVVWVGALAFLAVGRFTRTAAVVAWLLTVSFHNRASWLLNGGDALFRNALFYLMIAPAGAAWSLDSLRRTLRGYRDPAAGFDLDTGRSEPTPTFVPPWSLRLLQIHLCFVYVFTGLAKVPSADWINGEAVYWAINDVVLTRFPYAWLPVPMWVCKIASWTTLVFEIGFPLFVVIRRLRPWLLWLGIALHLGILVHFELGWFSIVTTAWYVLFLPGDAIAAFFGRSVVRFNLRPWRVYYDTFCPFCRRSRRMLEELDLGGRLIFRDIHDRAMMQAEAPGVSYTRALREMIVVSPDGTVTGGFDGFRSIARTLPALWLVLPLMYLPGAAWLGRRAYRWVAKRRFRLVRCDNGVCNLHLQALAKPDISEEEIGRVVQAARAAAGR
jgi:predicted DCC family thiol-disulfide oxidoreductase YuxK